MKMWVWIWIWIPWRERHKIDMGVHICELVVGLIGTTI